MKLAIRREAQGLWLNNLHSDDRVLVTGASGWFGRTAIAMTRVAGLELLATGSKNQQIQIDGQSQDVQTQSLETISAFKPTVVIDTAFATREMLLVLGQKAYVEINQKLIDQSLAIASLPSVRKYIGFSSGVTKHLAGQDSFSLKDNPYAAQKRIYESMMTELSYSIKKDLSIARVWSVTGSYVTKLGSFAFTDLISQADLGRVEIRSAHLVYRRFCALEEVLALALLPLRNYSRPVFDTGGNLIEIGELAKIVVELVSPNAEIHRKLDPSLPVDDYHSDNLDWVKLSRLGKLSPDTVRDQIIRLLDYRN